MGARPRGHLRRRPRGDAADGAARGPDPAATCRAPLRRRSHVRLPPRSAGRAQAARLGRGRCRRLLPRARLAPVRLPDPRALQVPLRRLGDRPPDPPIGAGPRPAHQRRASLGRDRAPPVPARRVREDLPRRLPRGLPARQTRGARAGPVEGLRPASRDLGRGDARARPDERPRLGAPQLRDLPRDALRRNEPALDRLRGPRVVRRRRRRALQRPRPASSSA